MQRRVLKSLQCNRTSLSFWKVVLHGLVVLLSEYQRSFYYHVGFGKSSMFNLWFGTTHLSSLISGSFCAIGLACLNFATFCKLNIEFRNLNRWYLEGSFAEKKRAFRCEYSTALQKPYTKHCNRIIFFFSKSNNLDYFNVPTA